MQIYVIFHQLSDRAISPARSLTLLQSDVTSADDTKLTLPAVRAHISGSRFPAKSRTSVSIRLPRLIRQSTLGVFLLLMHSWEIAEGAVGTADRTGRCLIILCVLGSNKPSCLHCCRRFQIYQLFTQRTLTWTALLSLFLWTVHKSNQGFPHPFQEVCTILLKLLNWMAIKFIQFLLILKIKQISINYWPYHDL